MIKAKVVHIITKMELGGAQENTLFTVSHLNPGVFDSFLIAGPEGELYAEAKQLRNFFTAPDLIREVRPLRDLKAFFQIAGLLKKIKALDPASAPVIVHTHSSKAGILGRWAAKAAGISLIIHSIHGYGFNDYQALPVRMLYVLLEKITSRITSRFIAVSRANIEEGMRLNLFTREKVVLVRSGIDISRFQTPSVPREQMRKSLGLPEAAPAAVMISCFKPQKAPLDFVRACRLVKNKVPEAHFLLVGDGALRGVIEKEVAEKNLTACFHLPGWRRDVPEILHASDMLVLSSLWEGLPRVLPQAMCAGIPIVATRVNGSPEAVQDSVSGFLVSPGDVQGLAEKIIFCLENQGRASEMGKIGAGMVKEFDIFKMVADQEKLYADLLINKT